MIAGLDRIVVTTTGKMNGVIRLKELQDLEEVGVLSIMMTHPRTPRRNLVLTQGEESNPMLKTTLGSWPDQGIHEVPLRVPPLLIGIHDIKEQGNDGGLRGREGVLPRSPYGMRPIQAPLPGGKSLIPEPTNKSLEVVIPPEELLVVDPRSTMEDLGPRRTQEEGDEEGRKGREGVGVLQGNTRNQP